MTRLAHAIRLARIDVTRMVRKHTASERGVARLASLAVYVLLALGLTLGGGYLMFRFGDDLVAGGVDMGPTAVLGGARGLLGVFWVVGVVIFVVRAVGARGTLTNAEGVLTTVPERTALLGVLLAEYVYVLLWLLAPAAGVGVGLALGTGTVWPAAGVPLAIALLGVTVVAVGYPLGVGIRHVVTRFPWVARHKNLVVAVVFAGYFLLLLTGTLDRVMVALFDPMQASPVGWFADLALLGLGSLGADPLRAGGAVVLTAGLALAGTAAGTAVVRRHWFSDPALAGETDDEPQTTRDAPGDDGTTPSHSTRDELASRLAPLVGRSTAALVVLAWRRAARAPLKLLYAAYPLLLLAGMGAEVVQTGNVPTYLPVFILVFVAWAAGVVFTLNPLGDQGAVLPTTLLSHVTGREFVRAQILAALLVAVPLGVVVTATVAILSPLDPTTVVVLVAATPVVMAVVAGLSVGIGMAFPRFEEAKVTKSMKTVIPSRLGFVLLTLHLFLTTTAAVVVYEPVAREVGAALLSFLLPFGLTVSADRLFTASAVALVPLVLAPFASYRYAVRSYDGYTLD
ncbi:hypothetical protein ACKVMT_15770 [Halobacteriales archaeon Cl-PHB]